MKDVKIPTPLQLQTFLEDNTNTMIIGQVSPCKNSFDLCHKLKPQMEIGSEPVAKTRVGMSFINNIKILRQKRKDELFRE